MRSGSRLGLAGRWFWRAAAESPLMTSTGARAWHAPVADGPQQTMSNGQVPVSLAGRTGRRSPGAGVHRAAAAGRGHRRDGAPGPGDTAVRPEHRGAGEADRRYPGPLPEAAARAAPARGGVDPAAGQGVEAHRPASGGGGVDPGADRAVPGVHQLPQAARGLSPDRAKGAAVRGGGRAGWCDIDLDHKVAYISRQIQYTGSALAGTLVPGVRPDPKRVHVHRAGRRPADPGLPEPDLHPAGAGIGPCRRCACTTCGTARPASSWPPGWT
jgi:hypothetical protein